MMDQETRSLWSQIRGVAIHGEMLTSRLAVTPSLFTDWLTWRKLHPDTTVAALKRTTEVFRRNRFLHTPRLVIGLSHGNRARAWRLERMRDEQVVNDAVGDVPVVVFYEVASGTPMIYRRTVDGKEIHFQLNSREVVDRKSGSTWDMARGVALEGPHRGRKLQLLGGIVSDDNAWMTFFRYSTLYE